MESLDLQQSLLREFFFHKPEVITTESYEYINERKLQYDKEFKAEKVRVSTSGNQLGFDGLVGLDDAKMLLKEACLIPIKFPQFFTGSLKPWSRILLYGPPGTGKTLLAKALCEEIEGNFYSISSADILSSWLGESEKRVRQLFEVAKSSNKRSVIFIDEIDSLCRHRTQSEDEHTRRIKTELLCQLDGISESNNNLVVLAATNCPWDLDHAFQRRFERRILIDVPDQNSRRDLMESIFRSDKLEIDDFGWNKILEATDGYSCSDLTHLSKAAAFIPIRELQNCRFWRFTEDNMIAPCSSTYLGMMQNTLDKLPSERILPRLVGLSDIMKALKTTKKTVNNEMREKYYIYCNGN